MSLTKEVTGLIETGVVEPDAPRTVAGHEINNALIAALATAVTRLAQEVDQLTERVDTMRARYG